MPTYLVTGASSGIGLELCSALAARGDKVVATCRARASSMSRQDMLSELEGKHGGQIVVLEGVDVAKDEVGEKLAAQLKEKGVADIDVVVHNAGAIAGHGDARDAGGNPMDAQAFANITPDLMRSAFEVNTLGPLRVQQAVLPFMKQKAGAKVAIISTGMGSITDNSSGGTYAYRTSKAAVNMVGRCLAADLKKDPYEIAVAMVAPGFVATEFGPGKEAMAKWGAAPVGQAVEGIIKCMDSLTLEATGKFWMVRTSDGELEEFPF